ncbi:MAG: hypothetical protein IJ811_01980 [Clostridia bacterium]|nr:hypothetical protein [Clostridia bacterium]
MKNSLRIIAMLVVSVMALAVTTACAGFSITRRYSVSVDAQVENVTINVRYLEETEDGVTPVDVEEGEKFKRGTEIFVQVLNENDYRLRVYATVGKEVVAEAYVDAATEEDVGAGGLMGVELTGNMTITVEQVKYTLTIDNQIENATLNVRYLVETEEGMDVVDMESGVSYAEGTLIYVQVLNENDYRLHVSATVGEQVVDQAIIDAATEEDAGAGGLMGVELTADMTITLEQVKYTLTIVNKTENTTLNVRYLVETEEGTDVVDMESGVSYAEGTLIYVQVLNENDFDLLISATVGDEMVDFAVIDPAYEGETGAGGLMGVALTADMTITLEKNNLQ